jgi:hypothetical protein
MILNFEAGYMHAVFPHATSRRILAARAGSIYAPKPFYKATAGNLAGRVAMSELRSGQSRVCDVRKSRRTGFACCCPPAATTGRHAMFQSTHSTKTTIFTVILDTVRGRKRKKDHIDRMLAIEWLFSERAERLQVAAQSDFLGS